MMAPQAYAPTSTMALTSRATRVPSAFTPVLVSKMHGERVLVVWKTSSLESLSITGLPAFLASSATTIFSALSYLPPKPPPT